MHDEDGNKVVFCAEHKRDGMVNLPPPRVRRGTVTWRGWQQQDGALLWT